MNDSRSRIRYSALVRQIVARLKDQHFKHQHMIKWRIILQPALTTWESGECRIM